MLFHGTEGKIAILYWGYLFLFAGCILVKFPCFAIFAKLHCVSLEKRVWQSLRYYSWGKKSFLPSTQCPNRQLLLVHLNILLFTRMTCTQKLFNGKMAIWNIRIRSSGLLTCDAVPIIEFQLQPWLLILNACVPHHKLSSRGPIFWNPVQSVHILRHGRRIVGHNCQQAVTCCYMQHEREMNLAIKLLFLTLSQRSKQWRCVKTMFIHWRCVIVSWVMMIHCM